MWRKELLTGLKAGLPRWRWKAKNRGKTCLLEARKGNRNVTVAVTRSGMRFEINVKEGEEEEQQEATERSVNGIIGFLVTLLL